MRVVLPHVPDALSAETREACFALWPGEAEPLVINHGDDDGYWRIFRDLWDSGEDFAIIEQDIVPDERVRAVFGECPKPWCLFSYPIMEGQIAASSLGAVRFRAQLTAPHRGLFTTPVPWHGLDERVAMLLHQIGHAPHVHKRGVRHLHEYSEPVRWTLDADGEPHPLPVPQSR